MAPTIIEVTNKDSDNLQTLWIAKRDRENYNIDIVLDDIERTGGLTPTVKTGGTHCSRQYSEVTLASDDTWVDLMSWDMSATDIKEWGGKYLALSFGYQNDNHPSDVKFRLEIDLTPTMTVTDPVVGNDEDILPLGIIDVLPGFKHDGGNPNSGYTFNLQGYTSSQPQGINIDCVMLLPLDGLRIIKCTPYTLMENATLIDDGVDEWTYDDYSNTVVAGNHAALGERIMLQPNTDTRIFFVQRDNTDNYRADSEVQVTLKYQPRTEFLIGTT
jgi:hypothetical protein